ncbi:Na+/H+ antiporter NhaA [Microbacterium sp. EYE_5]|uniref:Na+/H+ antiporter NhaA n=1 Tax=unclassified Microbacterium TaxID=2609290 RepID=UPI002006CB1D|nr:MULTISPECIES: Na+/H+ antiporter NhaA [unclassified Microbacterium]MCK6079519.1 Na+/H+ antiporter NhaA [Microbacterium sp. EYE_382]MCK6084789.1 Na+/H+ antiporter NhaA [Microbacterium sp. EYE_384]MCK6122984.1 Na+/H+ antiporter NhaA [Microbacterium sp. EYE_80]MCK6125553.1 Na+/H+ antiporter NhaA [Microbacterium sp. EYE_79]MCK6140473.1 Na+/H+ antiporter NhaA [Microbacterium sp. EYE_39]
MSSSSPSRIAPHELWRGIRQTVRTDAFGGLLLLVATVAALVLANSPAAGWYTGLRGTSFGPEFLHLNLSVGHWTADGLLAIFFFVVGLELKEEIVAGRLRSPRIAAVPVIGALGGVIVPALIFVAFTASAPGDAVHGWAIPTATDIAFAIAVFAVVAKGLPPALRVFLLTLAVVDDLFAISIIATVYTDDLQPLWLLAALVPLALFGVAVRFGVRHWAILLPLAVVTWALVHASGVHATIAGVLLAFTVPATVTRRARVQVATDADGAPVFDPLTAHFADRFGSISTLVAIPVFAFFAAGVTVGGWDGLVSAFADPVTLGILFGLVVGKPVGILLAVFLLTRVPAVRRTFELRWLDLIGVGFLAGIGFTVALLVGELSFGEGSLADDHAKIGILTGSVIAAVLGGTMLAILSRRDRRD